jgi:hypothetical protein
MKKGMIILSLLLLMSMLLSSSGLAAPLSGTSGTSTQAATVFTKIVTFGWLTDLGITTATVDPIEGFTRFLLFLVLCLLLFKGAKAVGMGDGISIAITIVFSLLTTIFIPGTILLAAATSYGTVFSVIMLGIPLGLIVGSYFLLKEYHFIRAGLAALLWFVTNEMQAHMTAWITTAHYGTVVTSVVGLLDWVVYAAIAFMVLSLLQGASSLFSGRPSEEMDVKGTASHWWNKLKSKERRQKTSDMNQYLEDRKEMERIETSGDSLQDAKTLVAAVDGAKQISSAKEGTKVEKAVKKVKGDLDKAQKELRKVRSRTRRQQRRFHNAMDQLKKRRKELKDKEKDIETLELLEDNVLRKHKEVATEIKNALSAYNGSLSKNVGDFSTIVSALATWPHTFAASDSLGSAVTNMAADLKDDGAIDKGIKAAEKAEREALKDMSGALVEVQELLKWIPEHVE